jgi:hypothetical protein
MFVVLALAALKSQAIAQVIDPVPRSETVKEKVLRFLRSRQFKMGAGVSSVALSVLALALFYRSQLEKTPESELREGQKELLTNQSELREDQKELLTNQSPVGLGPLVDSNTSIPKSPQDEPKLHQDQLAESDAYKKVPELLEFYNFAQECSTHKDYCALFNDSSRMASVKKWLKINLEECSADFARYKREIREEALTWAQRLFVDKGIQEQDRNFIQKCKRFALLDEKSLAIKLMRTYLITLQDALFNLSKDFPDFYHPPKMLVNYNAQDKNKQSLRAYLELPCDLDSCLYGEFVEQFSRECRAVFYCGLTRSSRLPDGFKITSCSIGKEVMSVFDSVWEGWDEVALRMLKIEVLMENAGQLVTL